MKMILALAVVLMMWTSTAVRAGDGQTTDKAATQVCTFRISGMTCAGCEAAVRMAARSVDGVTDVTVSYVKGSAVVSFDPSKTNPTAIAKVITDKSGFKAEPVQTGTKK